MITMREDTVTSDVHEHASCHGAEHGPPPSKEARLAVMGV